MPKQHHAVQSFEPGPRPPIALTAVQSRQVEAIGYDKDTATLAVRFKRWDGGAGPTYHYPDVSPVVHAEFVGAESIGKYFGEHIKPLPFKKYHPDTVAEADAQAAEHVDASA